MTELAKYGGAANSQCFRDVMMYSLSVFSSALPEAVHVLADTLWRPALKPEEVCTHGDGVCVCDITTVRSDAL